MEKDEIKYWKVKSNTLKGNSYSDLRDEALELFSKIKKHTKRKPYLRSKYFSKQKVFLHHFWSHLFEKNPKDRSRRLKFFACAIDLILNSTYRPVITLPKEKSSLKWYRFYGETMNEQKFVVQVKEDSNGNKYLMSVFPYKQKTHL